MRKGKAVFKAGTWLQVRPCTPKRKLSKGQVAGSRSAQRLFSMHFAEAENFTRGNKSDVSSIPLRGAVAISTTRPEALNTALVRVKPGKTP